MVKLRSLDTIQKIIIFRALPELAKPLSPHNLIPFSGSQKQHFSGLTEPSTGDDNDHWNDNYNDDGGNFDESGAKNE